MDKPQRTPGPYSRARADHHRHGAGDSGRAAFLPILSGLAPSALSEDEPHADLAEPKPRESIADEIGAPLLVIEPASKELRAHLDHNTELTDVMLAASVEPELRRATTTDFEISIAEDLDRPGGTATVPRNC